MIAFAEESLSLAEPLVVGSDTITLCLKNSNWFDLRINAFSREELLGSKAEIVIDNAGNNTVILHLNRALREGEEIQIFLTATDGEGKAVETSVQYPVIGHFAPKLYQLRTRANEMWDIWQNAWCKAFLEGNVYLRTAFDNLPFTLFPDEAPEILVSEKGSESWVWISEPLQEEWNIALAFGIPVSLSSCEWDEETGAWVGPSGFDSVYLISPAGAKRIGITVVYERANQFRASWPIVEWIEEGVEEPLAFNCYGFGTARRFDGGMFAIVGPGAAWYAEYDVQHAISSISELITQCVWSPDGTVLSGEPPEGFVLPVTLW